MEMLYSSYALAWTFTRIRWWCLRTPVRTENVVGRSDSAVRAFVGAGGVSPTGAGSLIAFRRGGKWE